MAWSSEARKKASEGRARSAAARKVMRLIKDGPTEALDSAYRELERLDKGLAQEFRAGHYGRYAAKAAPGRSKAAAKPRKAPLKRATGPGATAAPVAGPRGSRRLGGGVKLGKQEGEARMLHLLYLLEGTTVSDIGSLLPEPELLRRFARSLEVLLSSLLPRD